MIRSTVCAVDWVCRVAKTRWPVSAAVSAVEIVSRSRISPTRITSGSWRRAARRPRREVRRVGADLALVDDRAFVLVQELDRVLDREDVVLALAVDHVDHRRQGRALAGAGRAGDEDEAARFAGELAQHRRHPEVLQGGDPVWDEAEGGADRAALQVGVDAEAGDVGDRVGEVDLVGDLEAFALVLAEDPEDHLAGHLRGQDREALHRLDLAAVADRRREAGGQVQVGGAALGDLGQHGGEIEVGGVHQVVTLTTSSRLVKPARIFERPSSRRVSIPSWWATAAISACGAEETVMSFSRSVIRITE